MAVTTDNTSKPILPRGADVRPIDSYNRAALYSGKALDFDGVNDYVSAGSADFLGLGTGSFSFAWYINSTENGNFNAVIDYRHTSGIGVLLDHRLGGIGGALQTAEGNFAFDITSATSSVSGDVFDGKWHHVVFVADRSTSDTRITFYIDGQLHYYDVSTNTQTSTIEDGQSLYLGGQNGSGSFFDGQLSGLKIFNTALTAAQVADLYNNPEKVVPTGVADSALKLWLPMMEGAGTTAYDGSGNGNHGTISGATYVNGIGAPVAQSAVIDWNKLYDFDGVDDQASNGSYQDTTGRKTYKVHFNSHDVTQQDQQIIQSYVNATEQNGFGATIAPFGGNPSVFGLRVIFGGTSGAQVSWPVENNTFYELVFTIDWDAQSVSNVTLNGESAPGTLGARVANPSGGLYIGSRINTMFLNGIVNYFEVVGEDKWTNASGFKSESGSYDMTITGSPTQILAPQGLTTGRDITGVNLFENVRKQGALNLDSNSWAEVHDNASLDFGTGEFTMEVWAKLAYENTGSSYNGVLGLGGSLSAGTTAYIYTRSAGPRFFIDGTSFTIAASLDNGNWHHLVVTRTDAGAIQTYYDGAEGEDSGTEASTITNTFDVLIGRDSGNTRYYKDQIAQPRIYNRALTASEVLNNYNVTKDLYI